MSELEAHSRQVRVKKRIVAINRLDRISRNYAYASGTHLETSECVNDPREGDETMMSEFEKLILEVQEKAAEMARKEAAEKVRDATEKAKKDTEKAKKDTERAREAAEKFAVDLARRLAEASFLTDEQRLQLFGGTMEEYQKALAKSRKRT